MKDKNGIEIIRENCKHKTPCNGCGLVERDCKVGDKHCQFTPSLNALEQRIATLQAREFTLKEIHFIKCNLDLNNPNKDGAYDMWAAIRTKCDAILKGATDER